MSDIRSALEKLSEKVESLEQVVEYYETTKSGEQRDMFAGPTDNKSSASNENASAISEEKKVAMAGRLDSAINKVEKMLADGS